MSFPNYIERSDNMSRIVLKFGGSSVGDESNFFDETHLLKVASIVKKVKEKGYEVIVVVSAMAGYTRKLKKMCMEVDTRNNDLESDLVLSSGEQISTGLLSRILQSSRFNLKAKPFMGWQLPIITNSKFGESFIKSIDKSKIDECLKNDIIPVIAGFQGVTENGVITTLGFDGSDTSAVAIASSAKADVCQFYKDVRGIYTANPRRVKKAKKLDKISSREMYVLSELGARILHPNSMKTAIKNELTLKIVPNFIDEEEGTLIVNEDFCGDLAGVTYYEYNRNKVTISVVGKILEKTDENKIIKELNRNKIFTEVINTEFDDMSITVEIGWVEQLDVALSSIHRIFNLDSDEFLDKEAFQGEGKQIYNDPAFKVIEDINNY
ncbi:MAG: aspartate kinase [Clostridiales bacterium]